MAKLGLVEAGYKYFNLDGADVMLHVPQGLQDALCNLRRDLVHYLDRDALAREGPA